MRVEWTKIEKERMKEIMNESRIKKKGENERENEWEKKEESINR